MSAYREESTVRASWVLEGADIERAYHAELQAGAHATRLAIAGTVAAAGLVYALTLPPVAALIGFVVLGVVGLWLARATTRRRSIEESYGASWEDRRHVQLEVTEDGLHIADRITEEQVAWELVLFWYEDEEAIYVLTSPEHRRVIPKRGLTTEQRTALRQLLSDRVKPGGEAAVRTARASQVPTVLFVIAASLLAASVIEFFARLF